MHPLCALVLGLLATLASARAVTDDCCSSLVLKDAAEELAVQTTQVVRITSRSRTHKFPSGEGQYELIPLASSDTQTTLEFAVPLQLDFWLTRSAFVPAFLFLDGDRQPISTAFGVSLPQAREGETASGKFKGAMWVGSVDVPPNARFVVVFHLKNREKDVLGLHTVPANTSAVSLPGGGVVVLQTKGQTVWVMVPLAKRGEITIHRAARSSLPRIPSIELASGEPLPRLPTVRLTVSNDSDCPFAYQERGSVNLWLEGRWIGSARVGEYLTASIPFGEHIVYANLHSGISLGQGFKNRMNFAQEETLLSATVDWGPPFVTFRQVASKDEFSQDNVEVGAEAIVRCNASR
jgi:hypothetical protein